MSQLAERIGKAKAEGRAALIAYVPVGYPDVAGSIESSGTSPVSPPSSWR